MIKRLAVLTLWWVASFSVAQAQQGLATGSTIHGNNTIQQAPSGGATHGDPGLNLPDRGDQGQPTAEEKKVEEQNNAATQICKGC